MSKRISDRKATELTMLEVQNSDDPVFLATVFVELVALLDGKKSMKADIFHQWLERIND